jgi:hypothetical protein
VAPMHGRRPAVLKLGPVRPPGRTAIAKRSNKNEAWRVLPIFLRVKKRKFAPNPAPQENFLYPRLTKRLRSSLTHRYSRSK